MANDAASLSLSQAQTAPDDGMRPFTKNCNQSAEGSSLLNARREAQLFRGLRLSIVKTTAHQLLSTARLRITLVSLLSFFFWFGLLLLFLEGFQILTATYVETIQALFSISFASLMLMLVFSSGIIVYSGLYRSREAAFLLTTPTSAQRIFGHKFQTALWFSSWGFVLLGSPMLVAYGVVADAPWHYFAMLLPFMFAFVYIPASIGSLCCLVLVYLLPRFRLHVLALLMAVAAAFVIGLSWSLIRSVESDLLTPRWFQEISGRLRIAEQRLLPSWWLAAGLLEASRRGTAAALSYQPWAHSILFLAVLVSNAMLFHLVAVSVASRIYRTGYSSLHADRPLRKRGRGALVDRLAMHGAVFLSREVRLLLVKDLRLFRRDPVQWSQFLIFFGLLGLYFINIRRFSYDVNYTTYVNMIGFLNLAVVGLILSTFTTRFIFPMISLEGRRFWILGLLPIKRSTILWSKFFFAAAGTTLPSTLLILLSGFMLGLPPVVMMVHQMVCLILCLGLSGIAAGLGAMMPDLREHSPSKIAAGFGGTLNLVLSAAFVILIVLLAAFFTHRYLAYPNDRNLWLLIGAMSLAAVSGALATIVPMRLGFSAFQRIEF